MELGAPNLFLLVVDSLRADAVFGDHIPTPNFDSYARHGAAFTQCVCTCTTTTPSFSSMLTGCYPPKHGVRGLQGYRLSTALTTMAEMFSNAGYDTHAEVTGPLLPETGILRGFKEANHRQAYKVPFFGWRENVVERIHAYAEPWFALLHIWEVHRPYRSPPDFAKRKDRGGYEAAVAATDEWLGPLLEALGDNTIVVITGDHGEDYPEGAVGLQMVQMSRKLRKGLALEKWFSFLERRLAGMEIGHGFALHEHLVRVPLLMAGPGIGHSTIEDQVRHVDLLPTLADLCGLEHPKGIDGRSLRPLLEGSPISVEPAYLEAVGVKLGGRRLVGARTPDFKLVRGAGRRPLLHKLSGEPDEKHNQYNRYPEVAHSLESFIEEISASEAVDESGMTSEEEAVVEQHLRDLGYL